MGGIFALILIASLAGNALLGKAYLGVRDQRTAAETQRDQVAEVAQTCSSNTLRVVKEADRRQVEGAAAAASAARAAMPHRKRAQQILSSPPSTPGNACKSAQDAVDDWLKGKK